MGKDTDNGERTNVESELVVSELSHLMWTGSVSADCSGNAHIYARGNKMGG